jgi:structural maintenance of chromosome 1
MKQLRKDRTRDAELQTLKAKLDAFHQRQNYCKHDIQVTVDINIPQANDELSQIDLRIAEVEERISGVTDSVDSRAHAVQQLEIELNRVEDQVFEQFCREINVENIRQYEEGQLKIHEEHARQLREYHEQITRLKNQLGYEQSRKMDGAIEKLKQSINKDKREAKEKGEKEKDLLKDVDQISLELEKFEEERTGRQRELDEKNVELSEVKSENSENQRKLLASERRIMTLVCVFMLTLWTRCCYTLPGLAECNYLLGQESITTYQY